MMVIICAQQHFYVLCTVEEVPINIIEFINIIENTENLSYADGENVEKLD